MIGFSLGDAFVGNSETIDYKISGKIEIDPSLLDEIIEKFENMKEDIK